MKKLVTKPKICENCGKSFKRTTEQASDWKVKKFCSKKCYWEFNKGKNNVNYINGTKSRPDGYLRYSNDKYVHRETMEKFLGRKLESSEHIHHINGNTSDNRIENLEIHTNSSHRKLEVKKQKRDKFGRFIKWLGR